MHARPEPPDRAVADGTSGDREPVQRWRLVIRRAASPAGLPQRDPIVEWGSSLSAAGLPLAGLDGPRPKARLAIAAPLPAGVAGEAELADLWLVERLPIWRVREAVAAGLPADCTLVDLYDVWLGEPSLPGRVVASVYRAALGGEVPIGQVRRAARALLDAETLPRERRRGDTARAYDLRPFLSGISVAPAEDGRVLVRIVLQHDPARGVGRPGEALAALGDALGEPALGPVSLVRERLLLAESRPAVTGRGAPSQESRRTGRPQASPVAQARQ